MSYKDYVVKLINENKDTGINIYLTLRFIGKIEDVIKRGLPEGFSDIKSYIKNALTELPFQIDKFKKSVEWIKNQDEWPNIVDNMNLHYDFDINKYLDNKVSESDKRLGLGNHGQV
jgi:hypothetical protein